MAEERKFQKLAGAGSVPNADGVVDLLQRFGYCGLGGCDGCRCAHFEVLGWSVDISCHKGEHCVRVHSGSLGTSATDGLPILAEVLSQFSYVDGYRVRLCEYSADHVNGQWVDRRWVKQQKCCYCGADRPDVDAYLCEACMTNERAVESYPLDTQAQADAVLSAAIERTS